MLVQLPGHRFVIIDAAEVIPPQPCPLCKQIEQRGHDRGWCWRCAGTGVIGDPLPQPGIALGPDGRARVFGGRRNQGEAVHRLHPCPL